MFISHLILTKVKKYVNMVVSAVYLTKQIRGKINFAL